MVKFAMLREVVVTHLVEYELLERCVVICLLTFGEIYTFLVVMLKRKS